jgi:hypothetical protein
MLGRHIYRVSPLATGGWSVRKEGEATARGSRDSRDEAAEFACELAAKDEPSKVVVEDTDGTLVEERAFGVDTGLMPEAEMSDGARGPGNKS